MVYVSLQSDTKNKHEHYLAQRQVLITQQQRGKGKGIQADGGVEGRGHQVRARTVN